MPLIPGLSFVPKRREVLHLGAKNIFCPINPYKDNPNKKYMFQQDQFKSQRAPTLKFFASYDNRGDCPRDQMKFRNCHILYFVEDGTIKVYEPHQRNTGFAQGCLINRNKIPNPDGGFFELGDLNLGKSVSLYGKMFKILDCDPFTKNYLKEMGYRVGSPEAEVTDPVYADRQEMDRHRTTLQKPRKHEYKSSAFYKSHPKCLHFYVIYNNKPRHFEYTRYASLYYNITDNTIKIVDEKKLLEYKNQLSMGNYDCCLILKPTLIPKRKKSLNLIGDYTNPVILNLFAPSKYMHLQELMNTRSGGINNPMGFLRDPNPEISPEESDKYYTAKDLDLGVTLDIFGSKVYFYDCDEFTKEFYRNEFNKELIPVSLPELKDSRYPQLVFKENFGNPEDSLQTCHKLPTMNIPQTLIDIYSIYKQSCYKGSSSDSLLKFYLNCRNGNDSNILKFLSHVITTDIFLKNKYFVIQWYLEDDTIEISGLELNFTLSPSNDAAFMRRMKLIKPTSEEENAGTCYYSYVDMFVGNIIYAMKKPFLIIEADEYTYEYMERRRDIFIHSNIKHVISHLFPLIRDKISIIQSSCEKYDLEKKGFVLYKDFKKILIDIIPKSFEQQFPEHQIKTLARYFAAEDYVGLKLEHLVSRIHAELKKQRFDDFEKLEILFLICDAENTEKSGYFKPDRVYEILRSYPLVMDRDLLKSFVYKFPNSNGLLSYEEVVRTLNYLDHPVKPPDLTPYAININWERIEKVKNLNKISYVSLLRELATEKCPNCQ